MFWLLGEKWLWILIGACCFIILGSFLILYIILLIPPIFRMVTIFGVTILGGLAGGYKDMLIDRRKKKQLY